MRRTIGLMAMAIAVLLVGTPLFGSGPVAAHASVTVGEYDLLVGWRDEPAIAGFLNGLDLQILNGTGAPVSGAEGTLNATLSTGPASVVMALEPQFGRDGWYTFDVIPTRPGAYAVRLFGSLGTTAVDVNVALDDVGPAADFAFPDPDPTARDLQGRINAADAAIARLESQVVVALGLAVLGLIGGGIGLAVGWRMSRVRRQAP